MIGLEKLSDEGAKSLAKLNRPRNEHDFSTGLVISDLLEEKVQNYRNGMEKVFTKDQVKAFIENPWGDIETDEFTLIEDDAANAFEGFDDSLNLPGLLELSDAAADSLSKITGGLTLSGITKLSDSALDSLANLAGEILDLSALTELSDAGAESLSKYSGEIVLLKVTELSETAAESLSKHDGYLNLLGLTKLSDNAAKNLSKHKGTLLLKGDIKELVIKFA